MQAGSTQLVLLDQNDFLTELGGTQGRGVTAATTTEDDKVYGTGRRVHHARRPFSLTGWDGFSLSCRGTDASHVPATVAHDAGYSSAPLPFVARYSLVVCSSGSAWGAGAAEMFSASWSRVRTITPVPPFGV